MLFTHLLNRRWPRSFKGILNCVQAYSLFVIWCGVLHVYLWICLDHILSPIRLVCGLLKDHIPTRQMRLELNLNITLHILIILLLHLQLRLVVVCHLSIKVLILQISI